MKKVFNDKHENVVYLNDVDCGKVYVAKSKGIGPEEILLIAHEPIGDKYRLISFKKNSVSRVCIIKNKFKSLKEMVGWLTGNGFDVFESDDLIEALAFINASL